MEREWGQKNPPVAYCLDGEVLCPNCIPFGEVWRAYAVAGDAWPRWCELRTCEHCGEALPEFKRKPRRKEGGHAARVAR